MACEGVRAENEPVFVSRYGRALGASGVRYKLAGYVAAAAKVSPAGGRSASRLTAFEGALHERASADEQQRAASQRCLPLKQCIERRGPPILEVAVLRESAS